MRKIKKGDNAKNYVIPNEGDFTFFGGLYRDVWLIVTESQHFATTDKAADGVYVSVPTVNAQSATVNVRSILVNSASERAGLVLEQVIKDPTGATVQTLKQNITLKAGETQTFNQLSKPIANPQLWTPETPNLYQVIVAQNAVMAMPKTNTTPAVMASTSQVRKLKISGS